MDTGALATAIKVLNGGFEIADAGVTASGVVSSGGTFKWNENGQDTTSMVFRSGAMLEVDAGHVGSDNISNGITEELLARGHPGRRRCPFRRRAGRVERRRRERRDSQQRRQDLRFVRRPRHRGHDQQRRHRGGIRRGSASGATVEGGGVLKVVSGGLTVSSLLEGSNPTGSGGKEIVGSGGIADATRVTGPGLLIISSGGSARRP